MQLALSTQADWQQGVLPPQMDITSSPGDVKLYRPSATFTRPSSAWLPDGTTVANAVARYWWGRWQNRWYMKDEWHTPADGDTQALYYEILDPEPQSKWSISALIRFYPDDGSVNPRISVTVDYTDGTSTTAQNSSIIKDGVERLLSATVSATAGKIVKRVRGWVLDHSGGTANKHSDVRHIQLEPGDVTDWRPSYKSGILVEGPTTNLFTNPGWNDGTLTGWSNYVAGIGAGTRTVESDTKWGKRLHLTKTAGGTTMTDCWGVSQAKNPWVISPGSKVTISVLFKVITADSTAVLQIYTDFSNGTTSYYGGGMHISLSTLVKSDHYACTSTLTPMGDGWYLLTTTTSQTDIVSGTCLFWIDSGNADIYLARSQFEALPYNTSFTSGSRSTESLALPTDHLGSDWTIEFWWNSLIPGPNITAQGTSPRILQIGTYYANCSLVLWAMYSGTATDPALNIYLKDPNVTGWSVATNVKYSGWYKQNQYLHIAVSCIGGSTFYVYISGVQYGPYNIPNPILNWAGNTMWLGGEGSVSHAFACYDDFHVSVPHRTAAEIATHASATSPLVADNKTLMLLGCDSNLTSSYPSRAAGECVFDLGTKQVDPVYIWNTITKPMGTDVTINRVRTGPSKGSWGEWGTLSRGGVTPWAPDRYLDVEFTLATTDPNQTPVLSQVDALTWDPIAATIPNPIAVRGVLDTRQLELSGTIPGEIPVLGTLARD
jgi:hypothetical protein